MEKISHLIYIYDNPKLKSQNMTFLLFIKNNIKNIRNMGVDLVIKMLTTEEAQAIKDINYYPTLITPNKLYTGYKEIIAIYQTNLQAYINYNKGSPPLRKADKEKEVESEDDIHDYFKSQLNGQKEVEQDSDAFGDGNNMMDTYRMMVDRRNKHIKESKLRTVETSYMEEKKDNIRHSNSNTSSSNSNNTSSNTRSNTQSTTIKAEDVPINMPSRDVDDDPQDDVIEKAYWSRISETN